MTVVRKLTCFTVSHEIHRLFRLYSLVNQDMRTESCTAGHRVLYVLVITRPRGDYEKYNLECALACECYSNNFVNAQFQLMSYMYHIHKELWLFVGPAKRTQMCVETTAIIPNICTFKFSDIFINTL